MKKKTVDMQITTYLYAPLYLSVFMLIITAYVATLDIKAVIIMAIFDILYVLSALLLYFHYKESIRKQLFKMSIDQGIIQKNLLLELNVPYTILDMDGTILWGNNEFCNLIGQDKKYRKNINAFFPALKSEVFPQEKIQKEIQLSNENRHFRVQIKRIGLQDADTDNIIEKKAASLKKKVKVKNKKQKNTDKQKNVRNIYAVYFYDETELHKYITENKNQKLVAGLIYIDNYEETLEGIEDVKRSLLIALVDRKINKYMQSLDAIVKKIATDKYIIVMQQKHLGELQQSKFAILDEVREINIGNEQSVTISMSLGVNGENYAQTYEYARMAMDMALGRGGNQAVIKDREKISYYGGKVQIVERNTRVKARIKAHALREIMETTDKVVIMGHKLPDVDAIGAAIGIYRMAKVMNKRPYIVVNKVTVSIRPIIEAFKANSLYEEDMFISGEQALDIVDAETLLVLVDVNRPSYTDASELLDMTKTVVVLDHHRQTSEIVNNPVLSYVEPNASSTCELVAEILQYAAERPNLKAIEADALYGGILIDTDNFVTKTGVRTFEAAAYLRRNGADVVRVRKMFRSDMNTYRTRAEAIKNVEIFMDKYAISIFNPGNVDSPTVAAAQVANSLLDISGIRASFVLTELEGVVYISARSIDDVNVQLIMEKFDGGGHANVAGAQIHDITAKEAVDQLKKELERMITEGDL